MFCMNTNMENKIKLVQNEAKKHQSIKQKVNQIQAQEKKTINNSSIKNLSAINSLGAVIVITTMFYIYIAGILSLFFPDHNFHFMREVMRILECIAISIVSYFFGGIFKKDKKNTADDSEQKTKSF